MIPGTANPAPPPVNVAPDAVVLAIGNETYTRAQFEAFIAALPDNLKAAANGPQKRKFIEQYAELETLAQEARSRKLDQKPGVQKLITLQTDQVLANQLYQDISAGVTPDAAALKAYYDQHKSEYDEAKARHILIRFKGSPVPAKPGEKDLTEEEALAKAKDLREKIVKGADFAGIAKAESADTGSGANGGELGSFGHGRMVKEFDQAAFSLPIGDVSEPIKTQFGYHIIQVESRGAKSFDEVKPQIEGKLKPELAKKAVDDVKAKTKVTINDDYFGK
jgi:peptidyl-prolyl cis-trans isomerase C